MSQSSNQNPQSKSQPQEHTQNENPLPTPSTTEQPPQQNDLLNNLLAALAPVVEFHKSVDTASDNDLRLYWDIRLVQGKDTPFTSISGHSSFPGALVGSQVAQLPGVLSREIAEKIAVPLAARVQDMIGDIAINSVMKNVAPDQQVKKPAIPAPAKPPALGSGDITAETLVPDSERNEVVDVMLPKHLVEDAAKIMNEIKPDE